MRNQIASAVIIIIATSSFAHAQAPSTESPRRNSAAQEKAKGSAQKTAPAAVLPQKSTLPPLDEVLDQALKNNPDVRVAEAKLREAEAELNRIRLHVSQKVITLLGEIGTQKKIVEEAEQRFSTQEKLRSREISSPEDLRGAQLTLEREKAKLAALEAEMPSLIGKLPKILSASSADRSILGIKLDVGVDTSLIEVRPFPADTAAISAAFSSDGTLVATQGADGKLRVLDARDGKLLFELLTMGNFAPPAPGSMAEKIREALNKPITLTVQDCTLGEVLSTVRAKVPEVPFHCHVGLPMKRSFQLEQLPLGACLQAIEDAFQNGPIRFVVRDYGILATTGGGAPPGAVSVENFWKRRVAEKPAKPSGRESGTSDSEANLPPAGLEGTVKAIDAKSGLLTITLGSDAGLRAGHSLEVFRTTPEPTYLGTIKILTVSQAEAVGKMTSSLARDKVQIGDRVTSNRITGR
jgi:hypothetical protein